MMGWVQGLVSVFIMGRKPSMGRQKIPIQKIENIDARQVCFSKRRAGLFKKASELCLLCGAEVAIIVFSPAGKVFSFGHPSVDSLVDRFLVRSNGSMSLSMVAMDAPHRGSALGELNRQYVDLLNQVEAERKRKERLEQAVRAARERHFGRDADIEELGLHELEQFKALLEEVKGRVLKRANEVAAIQQGSYLSPFLAVNAAPMVPPGMSFGGCRLFKNEKLV